jgi:DNA-binding transcriptional LysR family regulator
LFHAAIHSGKHAWPGTQGDFLIPEDEAIVVCSPNFYQQHFEAQAISIEQLRDKPLLHLSSRLEDWRTWFELQQCSNDVLAVKGARFELFTMLCQAAMAGLGLALIPRYMVQAELDQGHLLNPIAASLPSDTAYFLSYPEEHAQHGPLLAFKEWLLEQTQKTDPS